MILTNFLTFLHNIDVLFSNPHCLQFLELPLAGVTDSCAVETLTTVHFAQATEQSLRWGQLLVSSDLDWIRLTDLEVKGSVSHY